jgi:hypothetical protein
MLCFEYKPPYCALCEQVLEDQSHVIRCPKCPIRHEIRNQFKKDFLRLLVDTNTHSTTIRVLTYTINAWLNMATIPTLRDVAPKASTTFHRAYDFQHQIGWEQFFKGRIHIAWGEMHNHTQENTNTTHPLDAETWGGKIISLLWEFVLKIWFARNDSEHNLENESTAIKKRKLIERILWVNTKLDPRLKHPYRTSTAASLSVLPVSNLDIMMEQLHSIYHRHRLNPTTFDVS